MQIPFKNVPLPKGFYTDKLILDYTQFLKDNSLLLLEDEYISAVIKPFETTKFTFVITTTAEVNEKNILYDLNKIQDFLNNKLSGKTFGKSIRHFYFGYEISDFKGHLGPWKETVNLPRYGSRYKNLVVVKQFDYGQLKEKSRVEQFNTLKSKIIEAIDDIDKLNKKPKDFDIEKFKSFIDLSLTQYFKTYYH